MRMQREKETDRMIDKGFPCLKLSRTTQVMYTHGDQLWPRANSNRSVHPSWQFGSTLSTQRRAWGGSLEEIFWDFSAPPDGRTCWWTVWFYYLEKAAELNCKPRYAYSLGPSPGRGWPHCFSLLDKSVCCSLRRRSSREIPHPQLNFQAFLLLMKNIK